MSFHDATTQVSALAVKVLRGCPRRRGTPYLLGVSGLQGSGKSTLADAVLHEARRAGLHAVAFSLDDFYLSRADRAALARDVHPLLATRGVPGTHDAAWLARTLDDLRDGALPVAIPRFDKAHDDRAPRDDWQRITAAPDLVILEGWCVGVPAEAAAALVQPVNALERDDDGDGRWRRWVNDQLAAYAPVWSRLDRLVALQAPGWAIVKRWRTQAEKPRRAQGAPQAMDDDQLARFLDHYERISRQALRTLPALADVVFELDEARRVHQPPGSSSAA
jgi:D-glycerate 3-kinase